MTLTLMVVTTSRWTGGQGLTGTLCIPKDKPIPDTVTIRLRTKAEVSREGA